MNDELTTRLSRELHDQVDGWHAAPLTLDGVRGRARSIRRTRRIAIAGAAAVAVAAIAVPTALVGAGLDRSGGPDVPPATNSPTRAVDEASALGVPYLEGPTLTLPDGSTRELPQAYVGAVVLGDTAFGIHNDDSGFLVLDELDAGGNVVESERIDSAIAHNSDETAIAYVTHGQLVVRSESGRLELGDVGGDTPVRLVGGPDCANVGSDTCIVYLNEGRGGARLAVDTGASQPVPGDPLSVADVTEDGRISMVTGLKELPEPGSCGRVFDGQSGEEVFATCDYTLGRFSPDGRYLAATHSYRDGFGDGWRAILDAETGAELARYESPSGGITGSVWEDSQHLLITSWEDGEWKVTRLGVDGSTEVVLGPERAGQNHPSYVVLGPRF